MNTDSAIKLKKRTNIGGSPGWHGEVAGASVGTANRSFAKAVTASRDKIARFGE